MNTFELNLDGLVGPTHHYAGLGQGNIASLTNANTAANPQSAALQGLEKMRFIHNLGVKQALLPPHQRPNLHLLWQLGFKGTPKEQLIKAHKVAPELLSACYSASSMWTANAATITPSHDTLDNKVHFTPANLLTNIHRHQEAEFSGTLLSTIFADSHYFQHHPALPKTLYTADEGAANHNRLCPTHGDDGLHVFVYGRDMNTKIMPTQFPARQTRQASEAIARVHQIQEGKSLFVQQNPHAIDEGVFHNDVIAVANEQIFLFHEKAFLNQAEFLKTLQMNTRFPLQLIEIKDNQVSLQDAVHSYLFNSQLLTTPSRGLTAGSKSTVLIAPIECQRNLKVKNTIEQIIVDVNNSICEVHYLDLKQSMQNGGGPACLRLRVPLRETELNAMHQGVLINDLILDTLTNWVKKHYRTHLHSSCLADPLLINEVFTALDELTQILHLGSIYPFQNERTGL